MVQKLEDINYISFENNLGKMYLETRQSRKILRPLHDQTAVKMLSPFYMADSKGLLNHGYPFKLATKLCSFILYILSYSHFSHGCSIIFLCPAAPSYFLLLRSANVSCD